MTSLVDDVAGESAGGVPGDDDVIVDSDDDGEALERDIVRRRIDLFEKQVSK